MKENITGRSVRNFGFWSWGAVVGLVSLRNFVPEVAMNIGGKKADEDVVSQCVSRPGSVMYFFEIVET